jgi:anaerobic magnesium-protoporphyrin IX monomethyl ester cyclase
MKILLCTPTKYKTAASIKAIDSVFTCSEPLGVAYLAATLKTDGFEVEILHCEAENISSADLENRLRGRHYDLIGMNTDTPSWPTTVFDLATLRRRYPDSRLVIGGPHVNALWQEQQLGQVFTDAPGIDLAVYGEGENTLRELARRLAAGRDLSAVPGTAVREGNSVRLNPPRPLAENLDAFPFPALDLLPLEKYSRTPSSYQREPVRSVLTARGCPFSCVFCSRGAFGNTVRKRSVDNVMAEIDGLVKKYGARELRFWDDVFTMRENYVLELCRRLTPYKLTWSCNGRVNLLSDTMLGAMREAGCWEIDLGIESGNDQILQNINKKFTVRQARETIAQIRRHGIEVRIFIILGLPGETRETVQDSIAFSLECGADYASYYLPQAYPGTRLYEIAREQKALAADYSHYLITGSKPSYNNPAFRENELAELQRTAYRKFYRRPGYILRRLLAIRRAEDIKRYFKALAIFRV